MIGINTALADADTVGTAAAEYLVDSIIQPIEPERAGWLNDLLTEYTKKYYPYHESSYYLPPYRADGDCVCSVLGPIECLMKGVNWGPTWESAKGYNNAALMPSLNIFNNRLGLVSPLSSDYLHTVLLQHYIQKYTSLPCFHLKPLILGADLSFGQIQDQYDLPFFNAVDEIAIWTFIEVSGRTRKATSNALKCLYPQKTIHGLL